MTHHQNRKSFIQSSVEQFEKPLVNYAYHKTGDIERARDIVQETFMRLCKVEQPEIEDRLAPWLYTVCRNLALDMKRKEARMKQLDESQMDLFVSAAPQPLESMENSEDSGRALALIKTLPQQQKEAIWLKFRQGLKYKEIADVMETSVSNVGFLIHTGVNTIRGKLSSSNRISLKEARHEDR